MIHARFCLWNHAGFTTLRFSLLKAPSASLFLFLKGIAASTGTSNFLVAFMMVSLHSPTFWVDETNASQSSSIVEFWLLVWPCLLFFLLSSFSHFGPDFRPQILRSGSCLNFSQSSPGPQKSLWRVFLSMK